MHSPRAAAQARPAPPSAFEGKPVSKIIWVTVAALSFSSLALTKSSEHASAYALGFADPRSSVLSILLSLVKFSSPSHVLFGIGLLYYLRQLEPLFGTGKFAVYVLFSLVSSLLLQPLAAWFLRSVLGHAGALLCAPGPFWLTFALLPAYFFEIPRLYTGSNSTFGFSEKSVTYLCFLQLALSSGQLSLLPSLLGLFAGLLYYTAFLRVGACRNLALPARLTRALMTLTGSAPRAPVGFANALDASDALAQRVIASSAVDDGSAGDDFADLGQPGASAAGAGDAFMGPMPPLDLVEPTAGAVADLVAMGFEEARARNALRHCGNNVSIATNRLIEGMY